MVIHVSTMNPFLDQGCGVWERGGEGRGSKPTCKSHHSGNENKVPCPLLYN